MKREQKDKDKEYIKKYWVGMMDGAGSLEVNHWRMKNLQYRLVLNLQNNKENIEMLLKIQKIIGGYIINDPKEITIVTWIINNKIQVEKAIKIFDDYNLITIRKRHQLNFLKENLKRNDVNWYITERKNKYNNLLNVSNLTEVSYFNEWFSGFVEATGYFSLKVQKDNYFRISQKYEINLLLNIIKKFNITTKLREKKNEQYFIEVYKKNILKDLITHFENYPLLGEKKNSLKLFKNLCNS
jgi:hypothetical protein